MMGHNDRAHLITFNVGSLCTYKFAASILPLLEAPAEGFFTNFRSSAVEFDFMSSLVANRVPLMPTSGWEQQNATRN
jgi:hypothetical protein